MLDQTTKRKIDSARQILVGKVPDPKAQVEQITTALVYKFMDDMDKESEELGGEARFFTNGFSQYSWTKLLDKKLSGQERLDLYVQAITNMSKNPHIPQLFRDIFKNAFLPFRDPQTLTLFLKEIKEFSYDHSENLGDAFEYLLSILGSQGDAGQFRTPRHIIDFIIEVVNPKKNETILDPSCGTAGFLIRAYKHIVENNDGEDNKTGKPTDKEIPLTPAEKTKLMDNIVGYDISPDMVKLSLVNMYLHDFQNPKIHEYDTLTSDQRWNDMFNVIVANPPFMSPKGGIRPHNKFSIQANRSEVLFVDYIMEHLHTNGRAGVIVPEGIIFQSQNAYKQLRKNLLENGLFAVVSLPPGVFNPYAGVKTSILILDKEKAKRTDEILFLKVENDGFDLGAQRRKIDKNDLPEALKVINIWQQEKKIKSEITLWVKKEKIAADRDYNLTSDRYREIESFKNVKYPMVELGEVFGKVNKQIDPKKETGNIAYIGLENIESNTGQIVGNIETEISEIKSLKTEFKKGDILFGKLRPNLNKVWLADRNGICSTDIFVLRKKAENILPQIYALVLRDEDFNEQVLNGIKGAQLPRVGFTYFSNIKIPLLPLEVQKEIVSEIENKQNAINHAREIIKNLERERQYFGEELKKLKDVKWVKLANVATVIPGQSPKSDFYNENGHGTPFYQGKKEFGETYINKPSKWTTQITKIAKIGDILLSVRAPVGPVNLTNNKICIGRGLTAIRVKNIDRMFLFYILKSMENNIKGNGGAVFDSISQNQINALDIPLPSLKIQKKLVAEMEKEEEIIRQNKKLIEIMERKIENRLKNI